MPNSPQSQASHVTVNNASQTVYHARRIDSSRRSNAWHSGRMENFLREWRQDAVNKHQYDTAIFVADKLLAITGASPAAARLPPRLDRC
jgi:hypothetical protein